MKRNQKGFGAVEGMLLIIIVLLIGFIGYYVYHTRNSTSTTYNNAANSNNSIPVKTVDHTSDDAAITKAVKAKYPDAPNLQVSVKEYSGDFAKGTAGGNETGFAFIAKKENNNWTMIFAGQELPSKADGQKYGMPAGWYSTDY